MDGFYVIVRHMGFRFLSTLDEGFFSFLERRFWFTVPGFLGLYWVMRVYNCAAGFAGDGRRLLRWLASMER